jgi:YD repeat-containing protein
MVCEVNPLQVDTYTFDGTGGLPVHSATTYGYDGLGRVSSQVHLGNATLADASGHNAAGTLSGGVTEAVGGLVNGDANTAMSFDGSSALGQLPAAAFGSYPTSGSTTSYNLTFEAWFSTTSGGVILGQTNGSLPPDVPTGFAPAVYVDTSGAVRESLFYHGSFVQNVASGPYNDGRPHHVVAVYNSGADTLYVDGQLVGSIGQSQVGYASSYAYLLGNGYTGSGWPSTNGVWMPFKGTLDEVAVYGTALSTARVQAHFGAGSGYRAAVLADAPAAYYRMDDGAGGAGPETTVSRPQYVQNDNVQLAPGFASGIYLMDQQAFSDLEDPSGNRAQCAYSAFDGQAFTTGQTAGLTAGNVTTADRYTGCGSAPSFTPTGQIRTTHTYDALGNPLTTNTPDANAGVAGHTGCASGGASYSQCTSYDSTFGTLPVRSVNAANQVSTTGYQAPSQAMSFALADSSGHGTQASWTGNVAFGVPGLVGGDADTAMGFDGATVSVRLPSPSFGAYPTSGSTTAYSLTFEAWFSTTSGGVILGQTDGAQPPAAPAGYVPALYVDAGGALRESLLYHGSFGQNVAAGPYNDGRPHHVVATYANGVDSLYVDGALAGSRSSQSEVGYAGSYSYLLGTGYTPSWPNNNGGWYPFNGTLGDAAIYATALPAGRVQAHFGAGAGYRAAVLADAPATFLRLDDNTGAASGLGGFGLWPVTSTDANGQTTSIGYDRLGRETSRSLPGEPGGGAPAVVADQSGHGEAASWTGGVGFGVPGLVAGEAKTAMSFDGSTGYVRALSAAFGGYPASGSTNNYNLSFEAWFKTTSGGVILGQTDGTVPSGTPAGFVPALYVDTTGALRESLLYHGSFAQNVAAGPYNDGQPHHVVATYANGTDSLYVDGVLKTTMTAGETGYASTYAYMVGNGYSNSLWPSSNGGWYPFSGTLDEVAVYGSALPAGRVQAHFTAGAGYRTAVLADAPASYLRLDDRGASQATQTTSYTVWCGGTAAQAPCTEVDRTQRLNSTTTTTSRAFYDGLGHLVETRSPAPGGQDVVRYSFYDVSQRFLHMLVSLLAELCTSDCKWDYLPRPARGPALPRIQGCRPHSWRGMTPN